jgi:phosphoethanolamine N-methyltransferase
MSNKKEASRDEFRSYWVDEHGAPTLENMMLDSNAAVMDVLERPEILAELPNLSSKTVLELGAGIGRFSSSLAEKAARVTAVDFVEASCVINRDTNAKFTNLDVICEDVLKLVFEPNSFDIVFINWLHMYLADSEVRDLASRCLNWLKPGGRIFFRESCFHRSGNAPRSWNPTVYRDPRSYFKVYSGARGQDGSRFQLCKTSCVHAYVRMKNNPNQVWWIWEKCTSGHLIRYLDTQQYNYNSVFRYEQMFGSGFVSTGGEKLLHELCDSGELKIRGAGQRVLDIGCGLGGNMLFFASKGCYVHGVDISGLMVSIASERYLKYSPEIQQRISVQVGDVFDSNFIPNSFDIICCRDFLMHFSENDKQILLSKFHRWLAPGGSVVITDYVAQLPVNQYDAPFANYVQERSYHLFQQHEYMHLLNTLNFSAHSVDASVCGDKFVSYLTEQLDEYRTLVNRNITQLEQIKTNIVESEIFDRTYKSMNEYLASAVNDDELALTIAQSSADIAKKYADSKTESIKDERENVNWAEKYSTLKINACKNGQLGYAVFVAQTPTV